MNQRSIATILLIALMTMATNALATVSDWQVCYDLTSHNRIKKRLADGLNCKRKIERRDAALKKIEARVQIFEKRDQELAARLNSLTKERNDARQQRQAAEVQLRKAWIAFWSVTGSLVVIAGVTIAVVVVTK